MPEYLVIGQASWSKTIEAKNREEAIKKFSKTIPKALPDDIAVSISVADDVNYNTVWNREYDHMWDRKEEKSDD